MARAREHRNGKLEEALATLAQSHEMMRQSLTDARQTQVDMRQTQAALQQTLAAVQQSQATMVQTQATFLAQMAELKVDSDRRFARIEAILLDHTRILQEHSRILQALPDAVREKIGFKSPAQQA